MALHRIQAELLLLCDSFQGSYFHASMAITSLSLLDCKCNVGRVCLSPFPRIERWLLALTSPPPLFLRLVLRAPVSRALGGDRFSTSGMDGQGPDRGSGIEQKQTVATNRALALLCRDWAPRKLFARRGRRKALHKISFLSNTRFAFLLSSPSGPSEVRAWPPSLPSPSFIPLSSYRYFDMHQNVLATYAYVREGIQSIGMGSVRVCERQPPILSKDAAQYQKRRPRNSPEVVETVALCEACDGRLSCSAVQVALFHHPLLDSKAQRERERALLLLLLPL